VLKEAPALAALRKALSPRAFRNAEWVAVNCAAGQTLMEGYRARVKRRLDASR
jgi:hypothetical protein